MTRLPTYFVSHGGGPWPWMKEHNRGVFDQLEASLQEMARTLPEKPKAILVVTAHWEANTFTLSSGKRPGMLYDYSGFPEHTYHIQYPAPGDPALAKRVRCMLEEGGVAASIDPRRAFDHGTFTVMATAFPNADIPVVQLSLRHDRDPAAHLQVGRLLAPLRDEGVLIIGSGLSFHNLRHFNASAMEPSRAFDNWLQESVSRPRQEREQALLHWERAPSARFCHPEEDHFLPLIVAAGAGYEDAGTCVYHEDFMGAIAVSSFRFGTAA